MEGVAEILRSSFKMLLDRPKLFIPKIFSAAISSLLLIAFVTGHLNMLHMIILLPFVSLLGIVTPVIVSSMVKNSEGEGILVEGVREAFANWKGILGLFFLTFAFSFLIALIITPGFIAFLLTRNYIFLAAAIFTGLLLTLGSSFLMYFTPIALIGHEKIGESIGNAFNTSIENRKEVAFLTLFSFLLLIIASVSSSFLQNLSLAGFFLGRILSSIVGTYILVVSPSYYLKEGEENED